MIYTLRPYQQDASDASVDYLTDGGISNGIVVLPTGSGKSLVIADVANRLDAHAVIFNPSREILEQNLAKLESYGIDPAVFSASFGRREVGEITLATIGSVRKCPGAFKGVRYALVDECHLVNAKEGMYRDFFAALPGVRILGFTATPYRLATNSLGSELRFLTRTWPRVFRDLVYHQQIGKLFGEGYLCPLRYKEIPVLDASRMEVNTTGSDWTDKSVQLHLKDVDFGARLAEGVRRLLEAGRTPVVFTRFTTEARELADEIGDACQTVTAKTSPRQRQTILDAFKAGDIRCVANVGIIALGFDFPRLDTVVLGAPTRSLSRYYQQVGRAIRPHPEKPWAAVVDMVGSVEMFGRVEDLVLRPGGKTGEQWAYYTNRRQLTNVRLAEPSKSRSFWASAAGQARRKRRSP